MEAPIELGSFLGQAPARGLGTLISALSAQESVKCQEPIHSFKETPLSRLHPAVTATPARSLQGAGTERVQLQRHLCPHNYARNCSHCQLETKATLLEL